jgi:hypothetical protein
LACSDPRPWVRPRRRRGFSDLLDVEVHHLSWSFRDDNLRFSVVLVVRVDEPAAIETEIPQDFRVGSASDDRSVHSEFERDARGKTISGFVAWIRSRPRSLLMWRSGGVSVCWIGPVVPGHSICGTG